MRVAAAVTLLAIATAAFAQDPARRPRRPTFTEDPATIREYLGSEDAASIAWGAYSAALERVHEALPDVERAMARIERVAGENRRFCELALFDALIRLHARPDAGMLADWWQRGHRSSALILASRQAKEGVPFLLGALDRPACAEQWLAIDNLLLAAAPSEFVRACASALTVHVQIVVVDRERATVLGPFGIACTFPDVGPRGFPPTVVYELRTTPEDGDVLFAPGPTPVYFRRETNGGGGCRQFPSDAARRALDARNDYRLRCLAQLLRVPFERLGLEGRIELRHRWRDPAAYRETIGRELGSVRAEWRSLFDHLVANDLLTKAAAPAAPRIELTIEDQRADRSEPLPAHHDQGR